MTQYEAINAIQKVLESMPPMFKSSNDFFLCVSQEVAQHLFDEMHDLTGFPKIEVFDLSETLCDNSLCWGMKDGKMLFLDNNHLSRDGSYYVARKLIKVIDAH